MNELATHFVRLLAQTTVAMAVAVVAVGLILRALRVTSPAAHRVGWTLALLAGWWFVQFSIQAPWYDPVEASPPAANTALPVASTELPSDPSAPTDAATLLRQADVLLAMEPPPQTLAADKNGLIEIGPGDEIADSTPAGALPLDALIVNSAPLPADLDLPIGVGPIGRGPIGARPMAPKPLEVEAAVPAPPAPTSVWPLVAAVAWTLGVALSVIGWLVGYARFVRRLPKARPASEAWTEQWRALQAAHNIRRKIPLRVTENLGPMLCRLPRGYALLVPEALWRDLDAPQRAAVLRHELAHFLRRDVWKSLAVRCLALPHWFNPLSWWAVRQFDEAAEWACDRAAAANEPVTSYARTLVRLGESAARHAAYSPSARAASLSARVRRLLAGSSDADSIVKKLLLSSIALAAVLALAVRVELVAKERDESTVEEVAEPAPDAGVVELAPAESDVPGAGDAARPAASANDLVVNIEASGRYLVSGNPRSEEELTALLRQAETDNPGKVNVVIRADRETPWQSVNNVMKLCKAQNITNYSATRADAGDPNVEIKVEADPKAPDALAEANTALIEAGERGFVAASAAYNSDTITLDEVCAWSLRWLAAVEATAKNVDDKVAGKQANLERFQTLRTRIKALYDMGVRGGEAEKLAMTDYYVADAKRRVIHAEREAEQAKQRLSKAREKAIGQENQLREMSEIVAAVRQSQVRVELAKKAVVEAEKEIKRATEGPGPISLDIKQQELTTARKELASAERELLGAEQQFRAANEQAQSGRQGSSWQPGGAVPSPGEKSSRGEHGEATSARETIPTAADPNQAPRRKTAASEASTEDLKAAEEKVQAAKTHLEEMIRARTVANRVGPATYEAARLQAVEAERELEVALRELMEVRKMTQPAAAAPLIEDQLRALLSLEENLKQAKKRQREAWAAQVEADRSGDQDRSVAAEKQVAEAVRQVEAADLAIVVARGVKSSDAESASEANARRRVEESENELVDAEKKQAAAAQQKERVVTAGDEVNLAVVTEQLAQANLTLAAARRAARQRNEALQNLLKSRLQRDGASQAQPKGALGSDGALGVAIAPISKLRQQLQTAEDHLKQASRLREQYQVELEKATVEMQGAEDRDAYMPEIQEKIESDHKVRKLESDIAEYDLAIAKYKKLRKTGDVKVNHTMETYQKEMAGLQEKLAERTAELQEKFFEPARAQRVREARNRIDAAKVTIERLDGQIKECQQQIAELTSTIEKRDHDPRQGDVDDHKSKLRYNGRSFADWRTELETELSPARMREACGAFAAFARNGYGAEAAGPIVDVAGNRLSSSMNLSSPQGQLIDEAARLLADLPIEYILPAVNGSLASPQLGRRLFAIYVLGRRTDKSAAAIPPLLVGAQDADSNVSQLALSTLAQLDVKNDDVLAAIRAALASSDDKVVIAAIHVVGGVSPGEGHKPTPAIAEFAPDLIERLKSDNPKVALAALRALANCGVRAAPALPIVLPWLKEKDSPRQTLVLRLLYALGPRAAEATPLLIELADSGGAGEKEAIRCLGAIGPAAKDAVPRLMAIANSRSNTGAAAVRALGRMGPAAKESIPLLEKFATKTDWPHLREDARAALPFLRGEKPLSELPEGDGLTGTLPAVAPAPRPIISQ